LYVVLHDFIFLVMVISQELKLLCWKKKIIIYAKKSFTIHPKEHTMQ